MVNKTLSYDQLHQKCAAKQLCDLFADCRGVIHNTDGNNSEQKSPSSDDFSLRYEIDPKKGDLILIRGNHMITLTPCDAKHLMEIIAKFYTEGIVVLKDMDEHQGT